MSHEDKTPKDLIRELLVKEENQREKNNLDRYIDLEKQKEEQAEVTSELLFQNIKLGEERGKYESLLKQYQAKVDALKAAEAYVDILSEQTNDRISEIEREMKKLKEDEEVQKYIKREKK